MLAANCRHRIPCTGSSASSRFLCLAPPRGGRSFLPSPLPSVLFLLASAVLGSGRASYIAIFATEPAVPPRSTLQCPPAVHGGPQHRLNTWLPNAPERDMRENTWVPNAPARDKRENTWVPNARERDKRENTWVPNASERDKRENTWVPNASEAAPGGPRRPPQGPRTERVKLLHIWCRFVDFFWLLCLPPLLAAQTTTC